MKHTVEYALIHHDGKNTWKIKDLSVLLRHYDECVEALKKLLKHGSLDPSGLHKFSPEYQQAKHALDDTEAPHA